MTDSELLLTDREEPMKAEEQVVFLAELLNLIGEPQDLVKGVHQYTHLRSRRLYAGGIPGR